MINAELVHFCNAKKKAQLRIKNQLGPFVYNTREAWKEAEIFLEEHLKLQKSFGWKPYDHNNFICDRRMKNRLSPYIHHRIPEIEQYANMDQWREGTLVEHDSEQVNFEKVMRNLEKTLDLDSFGQVPFKLSQISGVGASSARTSQQPSQETSTPITGKLKGKELETNFQHIEHHAMSKQPKTSRE